jgi:hypothetical protein
MTFELFPWRFTFCALEPLSFPAGKSGNILRGAFGTISHDLFTAAGSPTAGAPVFQPRSQGRGPSGLSESPRPFVFRSANLDGRTFSPGERFYFDLHVFISPYPPLSIFVLTFEQLVREGLGPGRGKAILESVWQLDEAHKPSEQLYRSGSSMMQAEPLVLPLSLDGSEVRRLAVRFVTPTELKSEKGIASRPEFHVLFGRARDRISTLRSLYGAGSLDLDFRAMGERARSVQITRCDLHHVEVERRSTRTLQTHPIGGFVGDVEYRGELTEFLPFLRVAEWTGVGRQTVWGKGEIRSESRDGTCTRC